MVTIGYKKGLDNCLIVLEIIIQTENEYCGDEVRQVTLNNQDRTDYLSHENLLTASYRCNSAKVIDIYDIFTNEKKSVARSIYNKNFIYQVNEIVVADHYDRDKNMINSGGIHYYLSVEPAFYHNFVPTIYKHHYNNNLKIPQTLKLKEKYVLSTYTGKYDAWYANGYVEIQCKYRNGLIHGTYNSWHNNGQKLTECNYVKGQKNGIYTRYQYDGHIEYVNVYKNGEIKNSRKYDSSATSNLLFINADEDGLYKSIKN
jgi:antitoxin component YwqK of YwqJK toxin-antitoxin module